jgi:hypothetical protein
MAWRDLLQSDDETLVAPWVGGRSLRTYDRSWRIEGHLPRDFGWYSFEVMPRKVHCLSPVEPRSEALQRPTMGYLVGDRFVPDDSDRAVSPKLSEFVDSFERVRLIEPGLDRFVRVSVGRFCENGPLIYRGQEFPLGPEPEVLQAFLDQTSSVGHVSGVAPALDLSFRVESWIRRETERLRREELERRETEDRRRRLVEQLGTSVGRRALAQENFGEGARAALAVGGAIYLDHRDSTRVGEKVVRFSLNGQRFECVCNARSLRIIDSGICLTAEYDDADFEVGTRGDDYFTLESFPSVILEAQRLNHLVIFRHA